MKWRSHENCVAVVGLKKCGMERGPSFGPCDHSESLVILCFILGGIIDRSKSVHQHILRMPQAIRV